MMPEERLREIALELIASSKLPPETAASDIGSRPAPGADKVLLPSQQALGLC
jgi:hypothetical protein